MRVIDVNTELITEVTADKALKWLEQNAGKSYALELEKVIDSDVIVGIVDTPYGTVVMEVDIDDIDHENIDKWYSPLGYLLIADGFAECELKYRGGVK